MTRRSIVTERHVRWVEQLWRYGYVAEHHPRVSTSPVAGTVGLRARRRESFGAPQVVIDIAEKWADGSDPDGLHLEAHGCYLVGAAWHAQIGEGAEGAERLDVHREKAPPLMIHRHPLGRPDNDRVAERVLIAPEAWISRVEHLSAGLHLQMDEDD